MKASDDGFRDFVFVFADPLASLAFLLTVGAPTARYVSPNARSADALARLRRHWREVTATGSPEALAIDELLSALPHRRDAGRKEGPAASETVTACEVVTVGGSPLDDDDALGACLWAAWMTLPPSRRVPLLLADASVASEKFAGVERQLSRTSARREARDSSEALRQLRGQVFGTGIVDRAAREPDDDQLVQLLRDALRRHRSSAAPPVDQYAAVVQRLRHVRNRSSVIAALTVALIAAAAAAAFRFSAPTKAPGDRAALATAAATSVGSAPRTSAPVVTAQRGRADPALLSEALAAASSWQQAEAEAGTPADLAVLWGGTDATGTHLVVVRVRTHAVDPVIVEWTGSGLGVAGVYAIGGAAPDAPLAFAYAGRDGPRVGVLGPSGARRAAFGVDGTRSSSVAFDGTGFASLSSRGESERASAEVNLLDGTGRVIATAQVPPRA